MPSLPVREPSRYNFAAHWKNAIVTARGRSLDGGATFGSISVAGMTIMTGDTGSAVEAKYASRRDEILARHPTIRSDRRIAAEAT